jgi:phosphoserine aminotransferase
VVTKTYFTPGPSELYPTLASHMHTALANKIGTISHRSKQFQEIYKHTTDGIRKLLNLPDNYQILFLGSATEIWERIIQNCVETDSHHFVNGSFSKRFYEFSIELGKTAQKTEAVFGQGFYPENIEINPKVEAICLTQNETSSGVSMPVKDISAFREKNQNALIFVDSVSSLPFPDFDYSKIDSTFFSVQKCFGLPAGLGVWILNDRCIAKAKQMEEKGIRTGTYHNISSLLEKALVNQTPETPNVLNIYLLGKVVEDMLTKGVDTIRKETEVKADLLYKYIKTSKVFSAAVAEENHRSYTTIVANTSVSSAEVNKALAPFDMQVGSGYGKYKDSQIRIANFPAHSVDQVNLLVTKLQELFG